MLFTFKISRVQRNCIIDYVLIFSNTIETNFWSNSCSFRLWKRFEIFKRSTTVSIQWFFCFVIQHLTSFNATQLWWLVESRFNCLIMNEIPLMLNAKVKHPFPVIQGNSFIIKQLKRYSTTHQSWYVFVTEVQTNDRDFLCGIKRCAMLNYETEDGFCFLLKTSLTHGICLKYDGHLTWKPSV